MKTQSFEHVTLSHVNAADDEAIVAARVIATVLATDRMVARRVVCFELSFLSRAHARLLLIPCRLKSGRERREKMWETCVNTQKKTIKYMLLVRSRAVGSIDVTAAPIKPRLAKWFG